MKNIKFSTPCTIFFVGIGGISMSGLAKICMSFGHTVLGSDSVCSSETEELSQAGVKVFIGHDSRHIRADIDLVVFSGAIARDNPEIIMAENLGIKVIERSELLGIVARQYTHVIAVSGTHGKTTTTAMIAEVLRLAGKNPTIHVGGVSVNLGSNSVVGGKDILVLEACEYRESFRYLKPNILVVTNIEADHLDYYPNIDAIHGAFERLAKASKKVITSAQVGNLGRDCVVVDDIYTTKNVQFSDFGYDFDVCQKRQTKPTHFRLNMIGAHNISNAIFCIAVCRMLKIPTETIVLGLKNFRGVRRRYEKIGCACGTPIIIDYAHHPTEISCSLKGIMGVYKNVLVVFQPHTYSRTLKLMEQFVSVFENQQNVVIFKTYPAREKPISGGTARDLFERLPNPHKKYFEKESALLSYLQKYCKRYDAVLILGAGDLAEKLRGKFDG